MSLVSDAGSHLMPPADRARAAQISTALRRAARQSRVPALTISGGGGFRARKSDKLFWASMVASFVLLVALPVVAASLYYSLIASDQYVTEAKLALRTGESSLLDSLSGLAGLPSSQQYQDTQIVVNYISSRAMVDKLDSQLNLRRIFSGGDFDWWASFNADKQVEDLEKYWRNQVDAVIDQQSSIITLNVRAFRPEDSLALANKIIENSEELVNRFTDRSRADSLRDSKADLARAEARLLEASVGMRNERNRLGVISGEATALMIEKVAGELRLELARQQQDLAVLSRTVRADAPPVKNVTRRIDSLNAQIIAYQSQIADAGGAGGEATLADRMEKLARTQSAMDAAQKLYASAVVGYESARIDAETKHGYLLPFMRPALAQKSLYPRRWLSWFLVVIPAILIWSVIAGLGAMVRDNMAS